MDQQETPHLAHLALSLHSSQEWKDVEGNVYAIMVSSFQNHDHAKRPIYYLDYPLEESVLRKNADTVVVSVECASDGYPSPYSAVVEGRWTVCRKRIDLQFVRQNRNSIVIDCLISEAASPRKLFGFKGSLSPEQIREATNVQENG